MLRTGCQPWKAEYRIQTVYSAVREVARTRWKQQVAFVSLILNWSYFDLEKLCGHGGVWIILTMVVMMESIVLAYAFRE